MRSNHRSFSVVMASVVLTALGAASLATGCSTESASSDLATRPASPLQGSGPSDGFAQNPGEDASAGKNPPYRGNPLCHVEPDEAPPYGCMPDDDGYHPPNPAARACATPPPNVGDGGPAADYTSPGCRITREDGAGGTSVIRPYCFPTAAPTGVDGTMCNVGADCAPGFDCVVGATGIAKLCRHYCCAGTCKGNTSQNGSATFCDVQSLVDVPRKAPVCMPLKRCNTLLGTGECALTETCAVLTEAGDTGCVAIGDKQVGESCDESHCAAKLTCLGQPGSRKCFKLCKVTASDCPGSQTCATNAAFKDSDFGICQ